ncbi:MAG: hypothetical protein QOG48_490 [Verrucomicrobiota bacterium]
MHSRLIFSVAIVCFALAPIHAGEFSTREVSPRVQAIESTGTALFEVSAGYNYIHLGDAGIEQEHLHGGDVSAFFNLTSWLGIGGDFMANFGDRSQNFFGTAVELESRRFLYLGGLRITPWQNDRLRFFTEFLAGGVHAELEGSVGSVSRTFKDDGFAGAAGGGIDWRFSHRLAWRVLQADYLPTNLGDQWQHDVRVSTGIVISFGGR